MRIEIRAGIVPRLGAELIRTRGWGAPGFEWIEMPLNSEEDGVLTEEIGMLEKILTSKLISDIKSLCKDRFEKEGNDLGKRSCEVV